MDYFSIICKSVEKIEENLNEKINIEVIADSCHMSEFHFHRIFKGFTGYSLINYVRKRKLKKIGEELRETDKKVLEIAVDYGYESNEALTRIIKKETGFTPVEIRKGAECDIGIDKIPLWALRYNSRYKENDYKFEEMYINDFYFEGVKDVMTLDEEKNYEQIPQIMHKLSEVKANINIKEKETKERQFGIVKSAMIDISNPYKNTFQYYRGYSSKESKTKLPGIEYLKYDNIKCLKVWVGKSIEEHKKAVDYIFGVWASSGGYELDGTRFDLMEEIIDDENGIIDIFFYIPVK